MLAVDVWGHVHPSGVFLNLDLVAPIVLVAAAGLTRRSRDSALLLLAATAMATVASPAVHVLAHRSVTGHMVQHLVILLVAAPLVGVVAARAPGRGRRLPIVRHAAGMLGASTAPLVTGAIHASVVLLWHVPGPYDGAVASWWVHGLEHLTLLVSGAWWWAAVAHHAIRRAVPAAVVSLFGVATVGAAMGVFMMFAPEALYSHGGVEDQQTAGALMAGGTGFVYGGTALVLATIALNRLSAPRPPRVPAARLVIERRAGTRGAVLLVPVGLTVLASGALLALTDARSSAEPGASAVALSSTEEVGRELYRRDCASCHGADGSGSFRGTPLTEVGTASVSYVLTTGRMPITDPGEPVRRSEPAYNGEEIEALVAYTATLVDGPPPPALDLEAADAASGGVHYRLQCAACHGAEGIGGALALEGFAPSVLHSTPGEVANAMVAGPGAMPTFAATFDEDDMADIAAYVSVLQERPGTGISVPGGRVGEGLVAWVVAMGALVVGARWLGGRV